MDLNFKKIKEKARKVFKSHYVILVLACALAALAGSEFSGSLSINETTDMFNQIKYVIPGIQDKVENIKNTAASAGEKIALSGAFTKQRGVFSLILNSVGSNKIYFSFFGQVARGILVPDQGSNPHALHWKHGVLTTGACMLSCSVSCVWPFAILWTVAHQDPLSMGFSWQEYWSG